MSREDLVNLYETIIKIETIEECEEFFNDLLTFKEINAISQRLKAAELLLKNFTYDEVMKNVSISSATLSRVSRCIQQGSGYKKIINKK